MCKIIFRTFCLFLISTVSFAQTDYRTTEDGLNKLLNNPEFVKDVLEVSSSDFSVQKLDSYFAKYVPEYGNYKANTTALDVSKLYFANTGKISSTDLINKLGTAFKMKPNDLLNMQNILNGNAGISTSSNLTNMMYQRGKDAKTDFVVDKSIDFFQNKFGDGGLKSGLIDLGGGLLGGLINKMNQRYNEKMAKEAILSVALSDQNAYTFGDNSKFTSDQQDLVLHYKGDSKVGVNQMNYAGTVKAMDYSGAIEDYTKAIEAYKANPERAYYLYMAFVARGKSKMQIGAYRAAVNDYYFAQNVLETILSGGLPDKSVDMIYPVGWFDATNKKTFHKGKVDFKIGTLDKKDLLIVTINRAFAKYRLADYTGAIADCKTASEMSKSMISPNGRPNDYKDIILAITAMSEFGLGQYAESYATFTKANLNDDLISDNDGDGVTDFLDQDKGGAQYTYDKYEGLNYTEFYGLPEYFPFDISQIRGLSLYKANKIDEAIQVYENIQASEKVKAKYGGAEQKTFTKIGGDISALYSTLSSFYYAKGNKEKAVSLIDLAIKLNPDHIEYSEKKALYDKEMGVKAPTTKTAEAKTSKKDKDFYLTKHAALLSAGNKEDHYVLLSEAAKNYPTEFFNLLITSVQDLKDPSKAEAASKIYESDPLRSATFQIIQYQLSGDVAKEQEFVFKAFDNGMNFYDADMYHKLSLRKRTYYCKLFSKYGSMTNNNFVSATEDKAVTKRILDSTYQAMGNDPQFKAVMDSKIMKDTKTKQYTKALGTVQEYLKVLENQENISGSVPNEILDRVEALIILKRNAEAVKFAKSALNDKKLKMLRPYWKEAMIIDWITGIENIANGSCGG